MDLRLPNQSMDFELRGVHHLALVARDMAETVEFYENVLDMPLIKTLDMPEGQHFFSDCGAGDTLAFFWFPDAPEGICLGFAASPRELTAGDIAHEGAR